MYKKIKNDKNINLDPFLWNLVPPKTWDKVFI